MKQLHMYASECCNTTVATERAGYVLYRALVIVVLSLQGLACSLPIDRKRLKLLEFLGAKIELNLVGCLFF